MVEDEGRSCCRRWMAEWKMFLRCAWSQQARAVTYIQCEGYKLANALACFSAETVFFGDSGHALLQLSGTG